MSTQSYTIYTCNDKIIKLNFSLIKAPEPNGYDDDDDDYDDDYVILLSVRKKSFFFCTITCLDGTFIAHVLVIFICSSLFIMISV